MRVLWYDQYMDLHPILTVWFTSRRGFWIATLGVEGRLAWEWGGWVICKIMKAGRRGKMFLFFPFRFHNARSRRPKDRDLRDMEGGRCVWVMEELDWVLKRNHLIEEDLTMTMIYSGPFRIILFILDCSWPWLSACGLCLVPTLLLSKFCLFPLKGKKL